MTTRKTYIDYIVGNVNERTMLEQLAEEASKLTWAALKLIRTKGYSDNPTNIDVDVALGNIKEEMADTILLIDLVSMLLDAPPNNAISDCKIKRWADRLGFKEKGVNDR